MAAVGDHNELIAQMAQITSAAPDQVSQYLQQAEWDLQTALENFYTATAGDEPDFPQGSQDNEPDESDLTTAHGYGGTSGRTLGGDGVASRAVASSTTQPIPTTSSSSNSSSRAASSARGTNRGAAGLRTLRDLQGEGGSAGGRGPVPGSFGGDDDEDDEDRDQDMFAGGEKSGLAVQNPNSGGNSRDHIDQILRRAAQNVPRPGGDDEPATSRRSNFGGQGQTLGGEDVASTVIPAANAPTPGGSSGQGTPGRVHRELHLWRNGFSVDDGPLFRFDDPENAEVLAMINRGRAPLDLLGVEQGQEVDLQVHPHRDEDYQQPKKKYKPFGGEGQRLGAPTPGPGGASSSATTTAATSQPVSAAASSTSAAPAGPTVDDSTPTLTLQVRLGDGTQLRSRFNTTHTIGDVYDFVNASSSASSQRSYALMTTFPSKELKDKAQVLGDMSEFKRGGVVVQKWT